MGVAVSADPFSRPALDSDAVDLAWVRFHYHHLSSLDACRDMALAGVTWGEARLLLDASTLPSTARTLAGAAS